MRTYYKVNLEPDGKTLSAHPQSEGIPNWKALQQTTHKIFAIGKYNLLSGATYGGQTWFLVRGGTIFDPVAVSFTTGQLVSSIFTLLDYKDHPLD